MLNILLTILAVIGIVLLCIVGVILLLAFLLLFFSVRYKADIAYFDNEYKIQVRAAWLWGVLAYRLYMKKGEFSNGLSIFGIRLRRKEDAGKEKKRKEKKKELIHQEESLGKNNQDNDTDTVSAMEIGKAEESRNTESIESTEYVDHSKKTKKAEKKKKKKKSKISGRREFFKGITHKLKAIIEFLKNEDNKEVFRFIKSRFLEVLEHSKPKSIKGNLTIGFDDPSLTGQALGGLGILFAYLGKGIQITPDFEHKVLKGRLIVKGRIRLFNLLIIGWKCYRNKKLKKSFSELIRLTE